MEGLADFEIELLRGRNFAHLVTLGADGSPRSTVTWVDVDLETGFVLVNSALGRVKDRNMRRDPRVSLSVQDGADGHRYVAITGRVEEFVTGDEAERHIDSLSRRYDGEPWTYLPGQVRVLYRIRPDHIYRYGG